MLIIVQLRDFVNIFRPLYVNNITCSSLAVIPHLMRNPVSSFLDSRLRGNDKRGRGGNE